MAAPLSWLKLMLQKNTRGNEWSKKPPKAQESMWIVKRCITREATQTKMYLLSVCSQFAWHCPKLARKGAAVWKAGVTLWVRPTFLDEGLRRLWFFPLLLSQLCSVVSLGWDGSTSALIALRKALSIPRRRQERGSYDPGEGNVEEEDCQVLSVNHRITASSLNVFRSGSEMQNPWEPKSDRYYH